MPLLKSEYYELPKCYHQTIIRLLVQSPTRMFVYWEVSDQTIQAFNQSFENYSDCTPVLKVTNKTKNYSYLIPVDPYANNYYIQVEDSGCHYQVELGRCTKTKEYHNLYTSNQVTVPSATPTFQTNFIPDEILFANYLCIADKKKIKLYAPANYNRNFVKQNSTDFEGLSLAGSSDYQFQKTNAFII